MLFLLLLVPNGPTWRYQRYSPMHIYRFTTSKAQMQRIRKLNIQTQQHLPPLHTRTYDRQFATTLEQVFETTTRFIDHIADERVCTRTNIPKFGEIVLYVRLLTYSNIFAFSKINNSRQ